MVHVDWLMINMNHIFEAYDLTVFTIQWITRSELLYWTYGITVTVSLL